MSSQVDMFPANVVLVPADHETPVEALNATQVASGGVNLSVTRIVVMGSKLWVVKDSPSGYVIAFSDTVNPAAVHSDRNGGYLTTNSGKKLSWKKDESCGCGSRLRSWRPYSNMNSINDPTE